MKIHLKTRQCMHHRNLHRNFRRVLDVYITRCLKQKVIPRVHNPQTTSKHRKCENNAGQLAIILPYEIQLMRKKTRPI